MNAGTPHALIRQFRATLKPGKKIAVKEDAHIDTPCGTCARCCRSAFLVKLTPEEAQRLPHELRDGRPHLRHVGRDCEMFDVEANRCSIYESRPVACRQYDCRVQWLAGLRNTQRGREINERLLEWRVQVDGDLDLGIIMVIWIAARQMWQLDPDPDVGLVAGAAVMRAAFMRDKDLKRIGADARRAGAAQQVVATLNGQRNG